jgi:hypothetical protein
MELKMKIHIETVNGKFESAGFIEVVEPINPNNEIIKFVCEKQTFCIPKSKLNFYVIIEDGNDV